MPPRGPERNAGDRGRLRRLGRGVSDITTSDEFVDAVEAARSDAAQLGQLRADPAAYFRGKGVNIPNEVEVDFTEDASWLGCFYYYYWYYRIQYCYYVS